MMLLPVSISGFGLPQGAIVWLLEPVGVPDAQIVRAVDADSCCSAWSATCPGAFLYLGRKKPLT